MAHDIDNQSLHCYPIFSYSTKRLGSDPKLEDMMWASLTDALSKTPMGVTAENLAEKYNLTREEVDQFALNSQQKWGAAQQAGHFADEMAPIELKTKKVCTLNIRQWLYLRAKKFRSP